MPNYLEKVEDAAAIIASAQRISVVGCSGGGKSTLSRKLVRRFGFEYISMDRAIFWLPGWQARPRQEQRQRIAAIVTKDRWLMDGSNPSSFDMRLPRSDIVLWVRMPRWLCLWGAITRIAKGYGKARPGWLKGAPKDWISISCAISGISNAGTPRSSSRISRFMVPTCRYSSLKAENSFAAFLIFLLSRINSRSCHSSKRIAL